LRTARAPNLIDFKPLLGENTFIVGMAKITGRGADVVEGLALSDLMIDFPAGGQKPDPAVVHPINPARIANWQGVGVDAI